MVKPVYAPMDEAYLGVAETLIETFKRHVGAKKGGLIDEVDRYEGVGFDFRFIRGLATILERRSVFEAKSVVDPVKARSVVFEEANRTCFVASSTLRQQVLGKAAETLEVSVEDLNSSLWSDLEEELVLKDFNPLNPIDLLRYYNLCLTQTLLFRSTLLEFTVKSNWKRIFRGIKRLGLIYSAEKRPEGVYVTVDGPLSLFKLTDRYGTFVAKLLPAVVEGEGWKIRASIVGGWRGEKRLLQLELDEKEVGHLVKYVSQEPWQTERVFDSSVEERFARGFQALHSGWKLTREPEPLITGENVMIPDFSFEKDGLKVYMEVVGFWTQEYLERKTQKLKQLPEVDMIVAVDGKLACSKLKHVKGDIIVYEGDVPLKPVVTHLKVLEEENVAEQVNALRGRKVELRGDFLEMREVACMLGVSEEAVKRTLENVKVDGYRFLGDILVTEVKLKEIALKIEELTEQRLSKVLQTIEDMGGRKPYVVLEALGYEVRWRGLDPEKAVVQKKTS